MNEKKSFYICDPKKNVECSGRFSEHCGKECFCTTNRKYADDNHSAPLTNDEYYKIEVEKQLKLFLGKE